MGIFSFGGKKGKTNPAKPVGAPGTPIWGGYVESNEKNPDLIGIKRYKTFSEMLANVTIIAAGVRYYLNLIAKSTWTVVPADESPQAKEYAEIIETQMNSMETSWAGVVKRSAMSRFYGFSIQAWTAIKVDGVILFKDIAPRPQSTIERWDREDSGYINGVGQRSPQTGEELYLPRDRIIYMVDDSLNDSPEGLGLFRHITSASARLQRFEQLEGFGFETDLRGIPIGRAPLNAMNEAVKNGSLTAEEREVALSPLKTFMKKHIVNPALGYFMDSSSYISTGDNRNVSSTPKWDLELLKGGSTSQPEVAKAIERITREIARTLNVEGLLLGGESGTQALSVDKSLNLAVVVDSALDEIAETFEKDIIKRIGELNGWDLSLLPKFKTEAIRHRDIKQLTQALKDLADSGVMISPEDPLVNEILELMGLSPLDLKLERGLDLEDEESKDKTKEGLDIEEE